MKIAYLDCFSGVSGDMILGALVDAGLPFEQLQQALHRLSVAHEFELVCRKVRKHSLSATKIDVIVHEHTDSHPHPHSSHAHHHSHPHRTLNDIESIVIQSGLRSDLQEKIMRIFRRLAEAEGKIHGQPTEEVMLHEVSAIDSIVDIAGIVLALDILGIERIYTSPITLGRGIITCAHGVIPLPGPAVVELLKNYPVEYNHNIEGELCTPTGAAVITTLSSGFKKNLQMTTYAVGYGAGSREFQQLPNLLRISIGEEILRWDEDALSVIETNIDDMNPEVYPYLFDRLFSAGALDVCLIPAIMKKGRPGHILKVLSPDEQMEKLLSIIYEETTTIGARFYSVRRHKLPRHIVEMETPYGLMKVKVTEFDGRKRYNPEYEECKRIAEKHQIPIQQIYEYIYRLSH